MQSYFNNKTNGAFKRCWIFKLLFFLIIIFVLFNFSQTKAANRNIKYVYVKAVIDGDTIITKHNQQIRYIGIDAPELGQPFSAEAKKFNKDLVLHKIVRLEYDKKHQDYLGRDLAYVYIDKKFVNKVLVSQGLVKVLSVSPDTKCQKVFLKAQRNAQNKKNGIWPIFNQISWLPLPMSINPNAGSLVTPEANPEPFSFNKFWSN